VRYSGVAAQAIVEVVHASKFRHFNIRSPEILAFEEQRLSFVFRESIGKTVAEIQSSAVPAFAEITISFPSESSLVHCHGFHGDDSFLQKGVQPATKNWIAVAVGQNSRLDVTCG